METRKLTDFSIERILASNPEPGYHEDQTNLRVQPQHPQLGPSHGPPLQGQPLPGMRFGYQVSGLPPAHILAPPPCAFLGWNFATLLKAQSGNCGIHMAGESAQSQQVQRLRTIFTESQNRQLEALFHTDNYPTVAVRTHLATRIGLSVETVRVWFKNRRARRKRQACRSQVKHKGNSWTADEHPGRKMTPSGATRK